MFGLVEAGLPDAEVGRVYLMAGRPEEAVPYLRRAAASCTAFAAPVDQTRARLHLGMALEQTNDRDGACSAYRKVLDRWGHAKPRSVTADEARAHATKLGCAL
jgi:serine/threonine-protein kinase